MARSHGQNCILAYRWLLRTAFLESPRWIKGAAIQDSGDARVSSSPVKSPAVCSAHRLKGGSAGPTPLPVGRCWTANYSDRGRLQVPPSPVWTLPPSHLLHPASTAAPNPPPPPRKPLSASRAGRRDRGISCRTASSRGSFRWSQSACLNHYRLGAQIKPLWTFSAVSAEPPYARSRQCRLPGARLPLPLPCPCLRGARLLRPLPVPLPAPFSALPPGLARAALSKLQSKLSGGRRRRRRRLVAAAVVAVAWTPGGSLVVGQLVLPGVHGRGP